MQWTGTARGVSMWSLCQAHGGHCIVGVTSSGPGWPGCMPPSPASVPCPWAGWRRAAYQAQSVIAVVHVLCMPQRVWLWVHLNAAAVSLSLLLFVYALVTSS